MSYRTWLGDILFGVDIKDFIVKVGFYTTTLQSKQRALPLASKAISFKEINEVPIYL